MTFKKIQILLVIIFALGILFTQGCLNSDKISSSSFGSAIGASTTATGSTGSSSSGTGAPNNPTPPSTPPATFSGSTVDVFVGYGGVRGSSIDQGKTWQVGNDQANNDCWSYRKIAYGDKLWVAVTATGGFGRISTTPDGVHWRHFESSIGGESIVYGGGLFVSDAFTSTDGYNFNFRTINASVGGHAAMTYINGTFITSGDQNGIAVSTDGTNFTTKLPNYASPNANGYSSNMQTFAVGNGIVVGIAADRIASSPDNGATWVNQDDFFGYGKVAPTTAYQYNKFYSIIFDGSQFVIFGGSGSFGSVATTWKSADGVHWNQSVVSGASPFNAGGIAGAHFFASGSSYQWNLASNWFWSTDATTWTPSTSITVTPAIADTSSWYITSWVSGVPMSDPTRTPTLPASVLMPHAQLQAVCGYTSLPPGR